jgi:hypothetical protein
MTAKTALDLLAERVRHLETLEVSEIKPFDWLIPDPVVEVVGQVYIPWDCIVTGLHANTLGGTSCTLGVEERDTPGAAGTDILTADMVADANGESVTADFNDDVLARGHWLAVDISAVVGAVDWLSITLEVE